MSATTRLHMKIAVCIKQVPTREWQPRLNDDQTWVRDAGHQLRDERARRLRARGGAAPQGEARRGGRGRARPARPACSRSMREALARGADRAIHVAGRRARRRADACRDRRGRGRRGARARRSTWCSPGLQSDDQGHAQFGAGAGRAARHPALDDHHGGADQPTAPCGPSASSRAAGSSTSRCRCRRC